MIYKIVKILSKFIVDDARQVLGGNIQFGSQV